MDRNRENARAGGIPGAPSNLAPANLGDPNAGEQQVPEAQTTTPAEPTSERTTCNYELDRSIQYSRNAVGTISRLSIAVVVNQAALGLEASEESDATELISSGVSLDQLTDLVANSVGFDEARGDQVLYFFPFVDVAKLRKYPFHGMKIPPSTFSLRWLAW